MREYHINDTITKPQGFSGVCKLRNGDLLAAGDVWDTVPFPFQSIKVSYTRMDSTGNIIWTKFFPTTRNRTRDISADSTGCYFADFKVGAYCSIVHTDTAINPTWMRHITNSPTGFTTDIAMCRPVPGGGCYAVGSHANNLPNRDLLWVVKLDTAGNTVWSKSYGWTNHAIDADYSGMVVTAKGDIVLPFNITNKDTVNNTYSYSCGLMKLDSSGAPMWVRSYADSGDSKTPEAILLLPDSGFVIAGETVVGTVQAGTPYVFLLRTDKFGNEIWYHYYDQLSQTLYPVNGQSLMLANDGNLLYGFTHYIYGLSTAGELMECDTAGQPISAVRIGDITTDSICISQVIQSGGGIIAFGSHFTSVGTYLGQPVYHPMTINFTSPSNTFCDGQTPVVNVFSPKLIFDQPVMTITAGPIASYMTPVTLQPSHEVMNSCTQNGIENPATGNNGNVSIYPNPSSGDATVDVHFPNEKSLRFFMYDVNGRLLQTNAIQNNSSFKIKRNDCANGIYFIRIVSNDQEIYSGKVVFVD